jgi:predicted aspartyl protease
MVMQLRNGPPSPTSNSAPAATPQPSSPLAPAPPVAAKTTPSAPPKTTSAAYQKALDRADSARSIGKSATNTDDWQLAATRWQQAIALLQQVPKQDINYRYIKQHLGEFQQGLSIAQQRARGRKVQGKLKPAISADQQIDTTDYIAPAGGSSRSFQVPIKFRRDRIPVINVTFNGGQQFEMMVDTGASGTMITPAMATALGIKAAGEASIMTPAGRSSTNYGFVGQISAGGKSIYNTPVTIGPVGLLGHDFFGDCEVSFRRDVIEFADCSV